MEETNQLDIEPNTKHLNNLLADKAISYIANQKSADADKPFFLYLAPGATHSPHQVAKEWSDKYKGKFDGGWEKYREDVFKRQQSMGLLPKGTVLPPLQTGLKSWNTLSADEKKVFARFMEVYAGFLSYTDYEIGRVVNYLKENNLLDNTAIFVLIGDNGASKEGTYTGTTGTAEKSKGEDISFLLSQLDKFGTEYTSENYPLGWSQAANTPFRYWKSDANSEGGTHNPLIVHYPKGIKEKGGLRTQYSHVIDILPTTIELAGVKVPEQINGYPQRPIQGTSLVYSINEANAATRHPQQYYELHGGRSIYKDGWKAEVYHPRNTFSENGTQDINFTADFSKDKWELYNLNEDWTETKDLAASNPSKLEELKALFDSEATKYNVYPLRNYKAGVPSPEIKSKSIILPGTTTKTRVYIGKGAVKITANIETTKNTEGVIWATGGLTGGTSLYIKNGKLQYTITDGIKEETLVYPKALAAGKNTITVNYTDAKTLILFVNNEQVAQTTVSNAGKYLSSSSSEGISVGKDLNSPVTKIYTGPFPFTGVTGTVTIEQ